MALEKSTIDTAESKVSFSLKKLGFLTVKGTIADFQGSIAFDESDLANSNFDVSVGAATVDTENAKRDEHLKDNDFFHVSELPKISFQSTSIKKENKRFLAVGRLTILKETKEVSIPFTHQNGVFDGSFSLNRKDYDLGAKLPTLVVGNSVEISIHAKTN